MKYYELNANRYINDTYECDMSNLYNFFEKYLKAGARILDLGFGSGRDSLYFQKKYEVVGIDPTDAFCKHAKEIGVKNVLCMKAEDMNFNNEFDAIWACSSLLHINKNDLNNVFKKCSKALKENGIMYCSFKYGTFEGIKNDRYFIDLTEESIKEYLKDTGLNILETLITNDVRPGRENEKWLNLMTKKVS